MTRRRITRQHTGLTPDEEAWLTGRDIEGAGKLWWFRQGPHTVDRCRWLLAEYIDLVPPGRMRQLKRDIARWSGPRLRGIASFRRDEVLPDE